MDKDTKWREQGGATRRFWTEKEIECLTRLIDNKASLFDICTVFPTRTKAAIRLKVDELGMKFYTPEAEIDMDAFKRLMGEN